MSEAGCQKQLFASGRVEISSPLLSGNSILFASWGPRLEEHSFVYHSFMQKYWSLSAYDIPGTILKLWRSCSGKRKNDKNIYWWKFHSSWWRQMISRAYSVISAREKIRQERAEGVLGRSGFLNIYLTLFIWLLRVLVGRAGSLIFIAACKVFNWHVRSVPWPGGIKPRAPVLQAQKLSHWITREVRVTM